MKLKDWIDFNWQRDKNGHALCNLGDFYIKIMDDKSFQNSKVILSALISPFNARKIFGDMEIISIGKYTEDNYTTLSVLVYQKEME